MKKMSVEHVLKVKSQKLEGLDIFLDFIAYELKKLREIKNCQARYQPHQT